MNLINICRNPLKSGKWIEELRRQGVNLVIEAADVTNKQDIVDLRHRILKTMPPIGGVANGAMVMGNSFFADMSFETWQKVLRPKVDGSLVLDEVFAVDDLDFFVLFSSISAVTGQRGQANYAAANNVSDVKCDVSVIDTDKLLLVHGWFGFTETSPKSPRLGSRYRDDHWSRLHSEDRR